MASSITLRDERLDGEPGRELVGAMLVELEGRYGFVDPDAPEPGELAPPTGMFVVAYDAGAPIACGGLRWFADGVGEVKRMYVQPDGRRRGVGRAVLREVHRRAPSLGYARLVLETGVLQPEAIALYESEGYVPIAQYGPYAGLDSSRCFAYDLGPQGTSS